MLDAGDWRAFIVPKFQGEPRLNKPPLIYWLQAGAVRLAAGPRTSTDPYFRHQIWAHRIPTLLGACFAALATWRLGVAMFGGSAGWLGALLLASSFVVMVDARQARVDEVLLATIALAQLALWRVWRGARRRRAVGRWVVMLWVCVALGVLAKGPVAPLVLGLTAITVSALTGEWRWLRQTKPVWGLAILALTVGPWVALVIHQVGWDVYWQRAIVDEIVRRGISASEGHRGPPGYHLVMLLLTLWPGLLAIGPAVLLAARRGLRWGTAEPAASGGGRPVRRYVRRGRAAELYCVAWIVPCWLVFELVGTKLPHYTLPMFPALGLLCGRALLAPRRCWRPVLASWIGRAAVWGWVFLSLAIGVGVPVALLWTGAALTAASVSIVAGGLVLSSAIAGAIWARRFVLAQALAVALAGLSIGGSLGTILPTHPRVWLSSQVAACIRQIDPGGDRPLAAADYHEESLVYLTAGRVERISWWGLPDWLERHPDGLAVLVTHEYLDVPGVRELARWRGYNYSNSRIQELVLVEADHDVTPASAD